jgi:hypothetical protein
LVFDAVVVFAQAGQVSDRGGSAAGEWDDVVGFAPVGVPGAAGEAAVAVAGLDESAHGRVGQVGRCGGLDQHAGGFVEQDPGDAGVEAAASAAAVSSLRLAATGPMASAGPKQSAANSLT